MDSSKEDTCIETPRAEAIARLNDAFRFTGVGGLIVATSGVRALQRFNQLELIQALSAYDRFDLDNDPHGERDFGDLEVWGAELLWKIDYYDRELIYGSNDPADPEQTTRVLTVMLPLEY